MESRISIITLGVASLERSHAFYTSLGFGSSNGPEEGIIFYKTGGVCLALYPLDALAADVSPKLAPEGSGFSGITLAHNTRSRAEVDQVLALAKEAGGTIEKTARETDWGGYGGYFSDPDGHLWEVAFGASWEFNADGSLVVP